MSCGLRARPTLQPHADSCVTRPEYGVVASTGLYGGWAPGGGGRRVGGGGGGGTTGRGVERVFFNHWGGTGVERFLKGGRGEVWWVGAGWRAGWRAGWAVVGWGEVR